MVGNKTVHVGDYLPRAWHCKFNRCFQSAEGHGQSLDIETPRAEARLSACAADLTAETATRAIVKQSAIASSAASLLSV